MPADVNFGSQKVIDVKPVKTRKKKRIIFYLKISVVVLWALALLALADRFHYHYIYTPKVVAVAKPVVVAPVVKVEPAPQPVTDEAEPVFEDAPPPQEDMKPHVEALEARVAKLENANYDLLIYFGARDLKDSLDDQANFNEQLQFLKNALGDDTNVSGKIDILEQATSNGLVTRGKLLENLKALEKNMGSAANNGFTGSVKGALGNLVKVTKIEGEVDKGDYNSVIKRAELALKKPKITAAELQEIIDETKKLGKPADEFVRQANNLQRVLEVTDFLVIYTKSQTIQKDMALDNNG